MASNQIRKIVGCTCAGMPWTFPPKADFNGNCSLATPACIKARASRTCCDACRDRLPAVAWKTFPAFPVNAHPQFYVSGKRLIRKPVYGWKLESKSNVAIEIMDAEYSMSFVSWSISWWLHQMKTFSASLALCVGNSPVTGEFTTQRPVSWRFDVFFDLRLNKTAQQTIATPVISDALALIMTSLWCKFTCHYCYIQFYLYCKDIVFIFCNFLRTLYGLFVVDMIMFTSFISAWTISSAQVQHEPSRMLTRTLKNKVNYSQ